MKPTLRNRILSYFKSHPNDFIASGDIQRMVVMKTKYTPRTAVRQLQLLREEGRLEVEYRKKQHAHYRYIKSDYEKIHQRLQDFNQE